MQAFWSALERGGSGVGPIAEFDATAYPTRIAGEVRDFDPLRLCESQGGTAAGPLASVCSRGRDDGLRRCWIKAGVVDADRLGVIVGSSIGGISTLLRQHRALITSGPDKVSPFLIPMLTINMAAGQ